MSVARRLAVNLRPRVLLVDDETLLVRVWGRLLEEAATVTTANDLQQARALLEVTDFDVVLVDLMRREFSGAVLLEWLQQHRPRVRRVLASGLDANEGAAYVASGLAHDFLAKPASRLALVESVQLR